MTRTLRPVLAAAWAGLLLAACGAQPPPAASGAMPPAASSPVAPAPARVPVLPPPSAEGFANSLAVGQVIRGGCRMGGCWWYRVESVQRSGTNAAPVYTLDLTGGDSTHPGDTDYPERADGVAIDWDAAPKPAQVACSRSAPTASFGGEGHMLPLGPGGVSGAEQALAALYFAVCHAAARPDGELAARFRYELR